MEVMNPTFNIPMMGKCGNRFCLRIKYLCPMREIKSISEALIRPDSRTIPMICTISIMIDVIARCSIRLAFLMYQAM